MSKYYKISKKIKIAKEFATQDALDAYMKEHPNADKKMHKVVETEKSNETDGEKRPEIKQFENKLDDEMTESVGEVLSKIQDGSTKLSDKAGLSVSSEFSESGGIKGQIYMLHDGEHIMTIDAATGEISTDLSTSQLKNYMSGHDDLNKSAKEIKQLTNKVESEDISNKIIEGLQGQRDLPKNTTMTRSEDGNIHLHHGEEHIISINAETSEMTTSLDDKQMDNFINGRSPDEKHFTEKFKNKFTSEDSAKSLEDLGAGLDNENLTLKKEKDGNHVFDKDGNHIATFNTEDDTIHSDYNVSQLKNLSNGKSPDEKPIIEEPTLEKSKPTDEEQVQKTVEKKIQEPTETETQKESPTSPQEEQVQKTVEKKIQEPTETETQEESQPSKSTNVKSKIGDKAHTIISEQSNIFKSGQPTSKKSWKALKNMKKTLNSAIKKGGIPEDHHDLVDKMDQYDKTIATAIKFKGKTTPAAKAKVKEARKTLKKLQGEINNQMTDLGFNGDNTPIEFASEEAMKQYQMEHPNSDTSKHKIV